MKTPPPLQYLIVGPIFLVAGILFFTLWNVVKLPFDITIFGFNITGWAREDVGRDWLSIIFVVLGAAMFNFGWQRRKHEKKKEAGQESSVQK